MKGINITVSEGVEAQALVPVFVRVQRIQTHSQEGTDGQLVIEARGAGGGDAREGERERSGGELVGGEGVVIYSCSDREGLCI